MPSNSHKIKERSFDGIITFPGTARLAHPPTTPLLAAAIASWFGIPCLATADEQKTIEPPPEVIMRLTDDRRMLKHELRFSLIT
jgi:hypothetical protein